MRAEKGERFTRCAHVYFATIDALRSAQRTREESSAPRTLRKERVVRHPLQSQQLCPSKVRGDNARGDLLWNLLVFITEKHEHRHTDCPESESVAHRKERWCHGKHCSDARILGRLTATRSRSLKRRVTASQRIDVAQRGGSLGGKYTPRNVRLQVAATLPSVQWQVGPSEREDRESAQRESGRSDAARVHASPEKTVCQKTINQHREIPGAFAGEYEASKSVRCFGRRIAVMVNPRDDEALCCERLSQPRQLRSASARAV